MKVILSSKLEDRIKAVKSLDKDVPSLLPDAVAYPKNEDEILELVEHCIEEHIPLIPKGGGMSSAKGLLPLKGGIIIDMTSMNRKIEEDDNTITLEAGSHFHNPRVYPTLWKYSTVGGNFCGGSWGIGSYKYGPNWDQVIEVTMVNPRGKLVKLRGGDTKIAAHAEGTTGIVTRLRMLKLNKEIHAKMIVFNSVSEAIQYSEKIYENNYPLYHMVLRSPEIAKLSIGPDKWHLIVAYEEDEEFKDGVDASQIWENRDKFFAGVFYENFSKAYYTTYHFDFPLDPKILKGITEVEFANDNKAHVDFMTFSKEELDNIKKSFGKSSFDVEDIYINSRLSKEHIRKIIQYKKMYDKEDLFNPGKLQF
ncbi:FAD-binding oxidoreductase [Acidianus manzaensis]|uniref:FAD-binding PCMH-type domain-containing protein n=1 Tax=Acidianus manzaensis TaxID=282676 RepID=A0A1W6JYT0_9CREN|nr:FAD-binding oxidoreductase [Acidianus manzaensis]ARM75395.1 hypothetical protein B6F84_04700 [Acidianus manzaensis]